MDSIKIFPTGITNLDKMLDGGIPQSSLNVIAGLPGAGKTIMGHQILFNYIQQNPDARVLYITTLSEPLMKVVRYIMFDFRVQSRAEWRSSWR